MWEIVAMYNLTLLYKFYVSFMKVTSFVTAMGHWTLIQGSTYANVSFL